MSATDDVVTLDQVVRTYDNGKVQVHAVNQVSLAIHKGDFVALAGPSGSGKTTLLNLIGGLDVPDGGQVSVDGRPLNQLSGAELSDLRRDHIGFVFQAYNLIPVLTVKENMEYVMQLQGVPAEERNARVTKLLAEVGLEGMEDRFPNELSGGQQQRVAVARSIVSRPSMVLADEPTANLDSKTGAELLDLMKRLNRDHGMTFIFSTHDGEIMARAQRLIMLRDGRVESDEVRT